MTDFFFTWEYFAHIVPLFNPQERLFIGWLLIYALSAMVIWYFKFHKAPHKVSVGRFLLPKEIYFHRSSKFDLKVTLLGGTLEVVGMILGLLAGFQLSDYVKDQVSVSTSSFLGLFISPAFFQLNGLWVNILWTLLATVAFDLGRTLIHYAFHKIPMLWELHKLHHDAEILTPLTSYRQSLFENYMTGLTKGTFRGASVGLFLILFGPGNFNVLTIVGMGVPSLLSKFISNFRHSHLWFNLGIFGYLIGNPAGHLVHHSAETRHRDKNFANVFPIWDLLLGTLYIPSTEEHFKIGIKSATGKKVGSDSLYYFFIGSLIDAGRVAIGRPPKGYPDGSLHSPKMGCWCGPDCKSITTYAIDNPHPPPAWTKLSDLWKFRPSSHQKKALPISDRRKAI